MGSTWKGVPGTLVPFGTVVPSTTGPIRARLPWLERLRFPQQLRDIPALGNTETLCDLDKTRGNVTEYARTKTASDGVLET
jgi:hypothetical protein